MPIPKLTMKRSNQPRKPLFHLLAALALASTAAQTSADTVTLNSGVVHEGTLISETPDEISFEIGKSVKQIRTFKRSEIKSLTVVPPDEIAITGIRELLPTHNLLDEIAYRRMIDGAPKAFLASFPTSPLKPEVEKIIATLEAELAKVVDGGIKLNGEWITKEQIAADPYNHEAKIALAAVISHIADEEYLDSLRAFATLEQNFPDSTSYPAAVAAIREALPKHSARLAAQLEKSTRDNQRREVDYSRMREDQRANAEAAYKRQLDPFVKRHAAEKAAKQKWLDFHVWDLASIADAQEEAKNEQARLEKLDVKALTARATAIEEAASLAAAEKYEEAWEKLKPVGKFTAGSHAEKLKDTIAAGVRAAEAQAAEAAAAAQRAEQMKAREAEAAAKLAEARENNISTPIPGPGDPVVADAKPPVVASSSNGTSSSSSSADEVDYDASDDADEDGVNFDRTGGEEKESSGGGLSFITLLLILIPVMGIATFLSLRAAKNNVVEDFVPTETEDEDEEEGEQNPYSDEGNPLR